MHHHHHHHIGTPSHHHHHHSAPVASHHHSALHHHHDASNTHLLQHRYEGAHIDHNSHIISSGINPYVDQEHPYPERMYFMNPYGERSEIPHHPVPPEYAHKVKQFAVGRSVSDNVDLPDYATPNQVSGPVRPFTAYAANLTPQEATIGGCGELPHVPGHASLGCELRAIDDGVGGVRNAAVVHSLRPDGPAHAAGLRIGDIIARYGVFYINGPNGQCLKQMRWLMETTEPGSTVPLEVDRLGKVHFLTVQVGEAVGKRPRKYKVPAIGHPIRQWLESHREWSEREALSRGRTADGHHRSWREHLDAQRNAETRTGISGAHVPGGLFDRKPRHEIFIPQRNEFRGLGPTPTSTAPFRSGSESRRAALPPR